MAVERAIETGRLVPALKGWAVDLCTVNKPAFDGFVERTGGALQRLFEPSGVTSAVYEGRTSEPDLKAEIATNLGHKPTSKKA